MINEYPKISIIMPSYNQAEFLEEAIRSILIQEYTNVELIVIDGGSTDGSIDIIKKHAQSISYWISEPDSGQSYALNKGFNQATGAIMGWLNSDDTYQKDTFSAVAKVFQQPEIKIAISSQFGFMDKSGTIYGHKDNCFTSHKSLIRYWNTNGMTINQPCVFFRRNLLEEVGQRVDTNLHYAMDYELWLRFSLLTPFHIVQGHWANYRFHATSKSGSGFDKFYPEWNEVSRRYWGSRYSVSWFGHWFNYQLSRIKNAIR